MAIQILNNGELQSINRKKINDNFECLSLDTSRIYSHEKTGTAHTLTGTGDNIKFIATSDYIEGDTFKIGAIAVTVKNLIDFKTNDIVDCKKNNDVIDFGQKLTLKVPDTNVSSASVRNIEVRITDLTGALQSTNKIIMIRK